MADTRQTPAHAPSRPRRYNAEITGYAKSGSKVRQAAEKARQAMQSRARKEPTGAEKQGLGKARH